MAKKAAKAKKAVKKASAPTTSALAAAATSSASFELAANHPEKRYPSSDGQHDILCRWTDDRGTVCKVVPKGGSWDDA